MGFVVGFIAGLAAGFVAGALIAGEDNPLALLGAEPARRA